MINPRELDVLNILWRTGLPMTSTDIVNAGLGLSQSTVQAVLRKLLKSELVKVSGITHSGNVLSRTYEPDESSKGLILQQFLDDYCNFSNIISKEDLVVAMIQAEESKEQKVKEIKSLKKTLDELASSLK